MSKKDVGLYRAYLKCRLPLKASLCLLVLFQSTEKVSTLDWNLCGAVLLRKLFLEAPTLVYQFISSEAHLPLSPVTVLLSALRSWMEGWAGFKKLKFTLSHIFLCVNILQRWKN